MMKSILGKKSINRDMTSSPCWCYLPTRVILQFFAGEEHLQRRAAELANFVSYQLPDNYFNTYVEKILSVGKKSVEVASKKYFVLNNMLVVVRARAKIEEGIKKLNLGKIQALSVEDVLGKKPELK